MMSDIPGWSDGIHDSIRAVSSLVDSKFVYMTTGPNVPIVRQLTAAYLALRVEAWGGVQPVTRP